VRLDCSEHERAHLWPGSDYSLTASYDAHFVDHIDLAGVRCDLRSVHMIDCVVD
jgi:hypothetical protein